MTDDSTPTAELATRVEALRSAAAAVGAALAGRARERTSPACERAILRMCGVSGLSTASRPLALDVVEHLAAGRSDLLAHGVALPFAVAANEYDLEPQQLALEIADGHVDLGMETPLLDEPARRAAASRTFAAWIEAAWERFEVTRTARGELIQAFGDARKPWLASELRPFDAEHASGDAAALVPAGCDVLRVRVPPDGELRRDMSEVTDEAEWPVGTDAPAPAGSQRGLARLRRELDETAARHGRYVRLATRRVGLAAPEQAVVAGFERVDVVFSDPMDAIFEIGVDADRALADHAFAQRILVRAGSTLVLGAGPLASPELASGQSLDAATRAGRALALQALSVAFALDNGIPADRLALGAVPAAALGGAGAGPRAVAEVALRQLLFPRQRLVVDEQMFEGIDASLPGALVSWAGAGASIGCIVSTAPVPHFATAVGHLRGAMDAASWLLEGREIGELRGAALEHGRATLDAALRAVRTLAVSGPQAFVAPGARSIGGAGCVALEGGAREPVLG